MPRERDELYEAGGRLDAMQQAQDARSLTVSDSFDAERRAGVALFEAANWLLKCQRDYERKIPVRALDEAWEGLRHAAATFDAVAVSRERDSRA